MISGMTDAPAPLSRQESQRQTRDALVLAAREVFARDGYHAANLELIAREAGFSKGAVYSNFDSKADLFLAVMDANLEAALAEGGWDMFERPSDVPSDAEVEEVVEAIRGFALATLEFIAAAARDERLAPELAKRMRSLTTVYESMAEASRSPHDELTSAEMATLMAALDQGAALLMLGGSVAIDQGVLRAGMQRILDPERAMSAPRDASFDGPALHDKEVRERIARAISEPHGPPAGT